MMISVVIGLTTTNNFLSLDNYDLKKIIHLDSKAAKKSIKVSGINTNLSQPIHGELGNFDNIYIKISSTNSISLLDIEHDGFTVHAADQKESNENVNLIGLTFPLKHQKATILNLRKFINHSIKKKGNHIVKIKLCNKEEFENEEIIEKTIKIAVD
ncbi:hypothetical protein NH26_11050 [Flammeovirga pacifica]|uniref:Uncharacterized protein n=2 Tax=Flammeovirga pacifica TaxID=915059 RepID=A0A1S1Z0R8_FLAPC|nr:hypothetical protein NH26_11050 [Flammeovirga pacifica]